MEKSMNHNPIYWKPFLLKDLFDIRMGDKLDKNKMSQDNPTVNFVSRISFNNGVDIKVDRIEGKKTNSAGLLTVALGGEYLGSCFIQKEPFYTAQNVAIMEPKFAEMTYLVNLFISALVAFECQTKYYAFGRELNTHINTDFEINLPIIYINEQPFIDETFQYSKFGYTPDWSYIEKYMTSLKPSPLRTSRKKTTTSINFDSWREFSLYKIIFLRNGKGITAEEIELHPGNLNAVQSGEDNNGVIGKIDIDYCAKKAYTFTTDPCLTVARTGSAGFVSFQKSGCVVGDSAKLLQLEPDHASVECYLFIQAILLMNKFKYDYGRKVTEEKYLNETIVLPILCKNNVPILDSTRKYSDEGYIPDWDFMECYIKNLPYGDKI